LDDQPSAIRGSDQTDLTRGSFGKRDAYIGPFELPQGNYVVAVSNKSRTHFALTQFSQAQASGAQGALSNIRLEPIDSVSRISEDRFDTISPLRPTTAAGPEMVAFSPASAVPFNLSDITLFVSNGAARNVNFTNPLTGAVEAIYSTTGTSAVDFNANGFTSTNVDLAVAPDGRGITYQRSGVNTDANPGRFISVDVGSGGLNGAGATLQTSIARAVAGSNPVTFEVVRTNNTQGDGMVFDGFTFSDAILENGNTTQSFWGVARHARNGSTVSQPVLDANLAVVGLAGAGITKNVLYRLTSYGDAVVGTPKDPVGVAARNANQSAFGAGTNTIEHGYFVRQAGVTVNAGFQAGRISGFIEADGIVTGLASVGNRLYAVTNQGELMSMVARDAGQQWSDQYTVILDENGDPIQFSGVTNGPRNLNEEGVDFSQILFGVTTAGRMYAFDTNGVLQNIFPRGANFIDGAGLVGATGIDFSSLDVNLFHLSSLGATDTSHGRQAVFNNSSDTQAGGGNSLRFGFADPNAGVRLQPGIWNNAYNMPTLHNTVAGPGGARGAIESNLIDLREYSADDQPMLYFDYNLGTEANNGNAIGGAVPTAVDTFRVYGSGEDGNWILLGTNNDIATNPSTRKDFSAQALGQGSDEFDVANSGNVDAYGRNYVPSELFDRGEWRQARINLASLAGKRDVKIRFEFSTSGDFRSDDAQRGGVELVAVEGHRINDGETFVIDHGVVGQTTFEFELGLVLNIPSGASIQDGDQIKIGADLLTFSNNGGPKDIPFNALNTPTELADAVLLTLVANNYTVTRSPLTRNVLSISALAGNPLPTPTSTLDYQVLGADDAIIIGEPGVAAGNIPVLFDQTMTAVQVRDAVRTSLAAAFNVVGQETNIQVYRVRGNSILLHDTVGLTVVDSGPLTLSGAKIGDQFGPSDAGPNRFFEASRGARNNNVSGLQIDDIIIGFAERGETVYNASTAFNTFVNTPSYEPIFASGTTGLEEIEEGTYQLEIRTAADYGANQKNDPRLYFVDPATQAVVGRTIKTNDRLAKSYQLVLTSTSDVRDGDTFTLSDGYNVVTFEFDITTSAADRRLGIAPGNVPISVPPNATLEEMARAIRDGINSPGAQSMIKITAENGGDMDGAIAATGPRSVVVQLHGKAAGDILGNFALSANPGLPIQLVLSGQDTVFGEDLGDGNIKRDQGQFIISSSSISNSRGFGLNIDAAAQSQGALSPLAGQRPYPGAVRNLINLNSANVSPGVVVMNNVINRNLAGGIRVSGETVVTNGIAPSSVARIINNTLFGNKAGNDTGISVDENATPTILNNILANFVTGIQVASSNSTANTVLGGNIYQSNTANVAPFSLGASESFAIALPPTAPLFIDGANGYFYLRSLSQAIDSSIASLENRATLEEVKNAVGLPTSPLLAPSFDVNGLRRSDDPAVNSPAGLGQNVFIDRGAIDRVDFVGPIAVLQRPLDNDSFGVDSDPFNTYVRVNTNNFDFFEVLLDERTGTGTDARTVTAATVVVTENGRPLFEGVDYIFGFSANSRTIRLTPLAGYWRRESVYEITLINKPTLRIDAVSGATLLDGDTINLTTTSGNVATLEYDSGYVLGVPQTLTYVVPSQGSFGGGIADGQTFTITNGALVATFEFDTNNSIGAGNRRVAIAADQTTTQVRNAILAALSSPANADLNLAVRAVGTDSLQLGSLAVHATDVSGSRLSVRGTAAGVADGQLFTFDPIDGPAVTFEFNYTGDLNVLPGNQVITINRTDTPDEIAGKIATAMKPFVTNGFAPVQSVGLGSVYVGGKIGDTLTVSSSALTVQGAPGTSGSYTLSVPPAGGSSINDATQFSIRNSAGVLVVFEFNKDANVGAGNRGIFIRDTDTAADVALAVANAISVAGLGMTPTATGASIKLNEVRGTVVNVMTSPLTLSGVSGGAIAIPFVPSASFNSNLTATQLMTALASVGLGVKSYSLGYGTLLIEGLSSLTGVSTTLINPISDLASNWLQPNRANSLTQFTIVMPEVSIDFGDAIERPNTFATSNTLFVDNGVRHAIYPEDVPQLLLGRFVDGDVDGSPSVAADGDDSESSFVFSAGLPLGISSAGPARVTVSAVSPTMLGKQFTITDPSNNSVTYQFTDATQGPVPTGVIGIDLTGATTPTIAAARVQAAVLQSILDGDITGIISVLDGDVVALGGTSAHRFDLSASAGFVQRVAKGSIGLTVPASVAGLAQGQTLEIQDGSGNTVVFQVVDTVAPIAVVAGNVALPVTIAGATQSSFATAVAKAINDAIASNKLRLPPATIVGNAVVVDADDEDGVRFNGFFNPKTPAVQTFVTSSDSGYLDAWIDWNQDNDFDDAGEQILQTRAVQAGENVFTVSTPVGAVPGYTTARFRLSATGGLFTYGLAVGGEVEDYVIEVLAGEPPVAVNDPDLADADKYRVNEDGVLTVSAAFGVLKNDTDSDTPKSDLRVYDMDVNAPGVQPVVTTQNGTLVLNADGSFVYTPAPNFNGQDTFVYQVTDPRMVGNQPATVTITVNPVNDVPFANNDTITISEDAVQAWSGALFTSNDIQGITLPLPGLPITNEAGQNLRVKSVQLIDSTGAPLVPRTGETLSVAANTINYRPGSNYNSLINGPVRILLEVEDDGVSGFPAIADPKQAFSTLTVNITAVNDRPEFTIPNQTISITEDPVPGNQVRLNFLSNILAGPAADLANGVGPADDELGNIVGVPGQNVSFLVRAIDPSRFTATGQPAVIRTGTDGAFTFTLAPDVNSANSGPILVEVIAQDDGGGTLAQSQSIPQTITLLVTPVNDAPEFTISTTSFNTVEDAPRTVIANFLSNITPGPVTAVDEVGQSSGVTVDAVTPEYFSIRPRIIGAGDLEFQLAPNVNSLFTGSLNIVITVTDNGTPNATTTKTLTITAADINDAPSFSLNKAQVIVPEDNELLNGIPVSTELGLGKNIFAGPAGIPGVGAADENGLFPSVPAQTLTFNLTISNPGLFSQQPVMDSAGNLTFKTAPNRSGSSVVVVRLSDDGRVGPPPNNNLGPTATFTIVVTPVNDAPEFVIPASRSVNEDQGVVSVPGFATGIRPGPGGASDESNQELRFIVTAEDPSVFLVPPTIQPDGTLVFQTAKDVNNNTAGIKRRIFVSLIDSGADAPPPNDNLSDEQTFVLDINPVNDSPIPDVLTLSGVEDQALDVDALLVTAGDAPGPADESAQLVRMTQIERTTDKGGVVTPVFSGGRIVSFRYQPPLNLVGDDIIRYVVSDNGVPQESATGTITIQLSAVNDAPQFVAGPDITVPEDVAPFSAAWATNILAGPPSAIDEISGATAQTVAFEITTNNDALFAIKPFIDSAGVLSFTLARDANGRAVVDVTAVDSGATGGLNVNRSVTSKLTIIANPVNDAPGFNVLGNITIDEDSSRYSATAISNIVPAAGMNNVPATGTDEVGQTVTILTSNSNPSLFSVQPFINSAGVLEFVPAQDATGSAIVSVIARDNGPNTLPNVNESAPKTFTITLRPVNDAPIGVNDRYTTGEDTVLTVNAPGLLSNDRDADFPGDTISIDTFQATSSLGAIVSVLPDGSFSYDSRNSAQLQRLVDGETATDTFTYTLRDAAGLTSNLVTATIVVSGVNDSPVAVNDSFSVPFGISELLNVLANDKDPDSTIDPRTVEIGQLAAHGTAVALSTGRIEYRPAAGYRGPDSFTYRVRDAFGAISNEAIVTIVVNTAPVAVSDAVLTTINTPVVIDVLRNDADPDGTLNRASVSIASGPDVGSATVSSDGTIRYVPPADFIGTATLQYAVLDNEGLSSNLATVTVRVTGSIHQNPTNRLDVNNDGFVSPIDVLIVVNDLNFNGTRVLPSTLPVPPYLDVNGDRSVSPLDVLELINFINQRGGAGAGEGEGSMASLGYSQQNVLMVPEEEIIRASAEIELRTEMTRQLDLAVASVVNESVVYGPALPTVDSDSEDSDDTLESYLASWVTTKNKKSGEAIDSVFTDESWL
jgi:VCBS repeat-containing protein